MNAEQLPWERGYIQVYTGTGKGKTTAAFGLALRAAGAGVKVFIGQFIKGRPSAELEALARLAGLITVRQYGEGNFIRGKPTQQDIRAAQEGLAEIQHIATAGEYPLVILDEANIAVHLGLFSADDLLRVIRSKARHVELVITGRDAHQKIVEAADLVTEMREVKHYYQDGVEARRGIEK